MYIVTKLMRVGGSLTMIIPPIMREKMRLEPGEVLLIQYGFGKMNITKLTDSLAIEDKRGKDKKEDNGGE